MDSIVARIHALAQTADEAGRLEISKSLQQVQTDLQSPKDVLMDIANSSLALPTIRLGADLGLFRSLTNSKTPLTVDQIAELTQASPQLLERILRYLASINVVKEVDINQYAASTITYILADPKGEGMIYHGFDTHGPAVQAMPDFFAENNYQDITSSTYTPFQKAFNTKLSSFDWLVQHPKNFQALQKIMTALEGSEWTEGFELLNTEANETASSSSQPSNEPFLVDVGGGHGHQCVQLGKKYPDLLGRLVLQDLPEIVEKLAPIEGVKTEAYDFFKPQPITGAKFYYLRRIMHDWPDDEAVKILRNVAGAMGPDSRILIDEAVLPDTGANWQATMADLLVMTQLGGRERTKQQWNSLVECAGLRVEQIHTYVASTYTSVLVLARE